MYLINEYVKINNYKLVKIQSNTKTQQTEFFLSITVFFAWLNDYKKIFYG